MSSAAIRTLARAPMRAFTLVEMLVVLVVLGIAAALLLSLIHI